MAKTTTIEVWVKVDQDGDYEVGTTSEGAATRYGDEIGDDTERGVRMVKITLTVPLPEPIEIAATVAEEERVAVTVG